jgi:hypothetical protein
MNTSANVVTTPPFETTQASSPAKIAVAAPRSRIASIDVMRGLVMLFMLVDHVRENIYLHMQVSDPMNVETTEPGLFFTRDDLAALSALDAVAFGANRHDVIRAVSSAGEGVLAERDGMLAGFALMRQSGRGALIGPVVASDESLVMALVSHLASRVSGFVRIDVPTEAAQLGAWLDSVGLASVDRVTTMIRGTPPAVQSGARVFALISQALN